MAEQIFVYSSTISAPGMNLDSSLQNVFATFYVPSRLHKQFFSTCMWQLLFVT